MISKVSNRPSFKSAHIKYTPKSINVGTVVQNVNEMPVLKKLTEIVQGPKCNWKASFGTYETPFNPSCKMGFQIPERANNIIKAKIEDEEYGLYRDNPATFSSFDALYKLIKAGLKK